MPDAALFLIARIAGTKINRWRNLPAHPYKVTIMPTHLCNCRCKLCHIWELRKKGRELSLGEYAKTFRSMGNDLVWLAVSGGEPFLRKDLGDIIKEAASNCKRLNLIQINTNGIQSRTAQVLEELLQTLPKNIRLYVAVSLDGPEKTHNLLRGRKDAYRKANETLKGLRELSKEHENLYIETETLVSKLNIGEIGAMKDQEKRHFTFAVEGSHYNNAGRCSNKLTIGEIKQTSEMLAKNMHIRSPFDIIKKAVFIIASGHMGNSRHTQILPCYASWSSVWIDPFGEVRPCISFDKPMGCLRKNDYRLAKVTAGTQAKEVRSAIKSQRCAKCWTPCEASVSILQNPLLSLWRCVH